MSDEKIIKAFRKLNEIFEDSHCVEIFSNHEIDRNLIYGEFQQKGREYLNTLDANTITYMCNYIHLFVLDMFYIDINLYRKNELIYGCYRRHIPTSHVDFFGEFAEYYEERYPYADNLCNLNSDELYYKLSVNGKMAEGFFFNECLCPDNQYHFSRKLSLKNIDWSEWDDSDLSW